MIKILPAMTLLSVLAAPLSVPLAYGDEPVSLWTIEQLDQPESVVADPESRLLYISNINGQPTELNRKGYISRATVDGEVLDQYWVSGMDAPKGMAIKGNKLYVADMQTLHVVNLKKGRIIKQFNAPEAVMLNDVTVADDGSVYVSDFLGGAIYRLKGSKFEQWFSHEKLPYPNGLLWQKGELLVGNWGEGLNSDFSTEVPGTLYRLDTKTKTLAPVAAGHQLGNLDGIVVEGEHIYVSDWVSGELYKLGEDERVRVLMLNAGLADIGSANGVIYAPMMLDNSVTAWQMP